MSIVNEVRIDRLSVLLGVMEDERVRFVGNEWIGNGMSMEELCQSGYRVGELVELGVACCGLGWSVAIWGLECGDWLSGRLNGLRANGTHWLDWCYHWFADGEVVVGNIVYDCVFSSMWGRVVTRLVEETGMNYEEVDRRLFVYKLRRLVSDGVMYNPDCYDMSEFVGMLKD